MLREPTVELLVELTGALLRELLVEITLELLVEPTVEILVELTVEIPLELQGLYKDITKPLPRESNEKPTSLATRGQQEMQLVPTRNYNKSHQQVPTSANNKSQ